MKVGPSCVASCYVSEFRGGFRVLICIWGERVVKFSFCVYCIVFEDWREKWTDGVLCDNCGESSLFAVKAAKARWLGIFDGVDLATEDWIVDQMHIVKLAPD